MVETRAVEGAASGRPGKTQPPEADGRTEETGEEEGRETEARRGPTRQEGSEEEGGKEQVGPTSFRGGSVTSARGLGRIGGGLVGRA